MSEVGIYMYILFQPDNEACVKKILSGGGGEPASRSSRDSKSKDSKEKDRDKDRDRDRDRKDRDQSADKRKRRSDRGEVGDLCILTWGCGYSYLV